MKVGIMQPYFWPYLGYFQLIKEVDKFVIYDNIEYTKKGWFNRNRYLCNGTDKYFTIAIEKDSDYLDVKERKVSSSFDREKMKKQIKAAYQKAPYFEDVYKVFCECLDFHNDNLFEYIYYSIKRLVQYLGIDTEIVVSSTIDINHELRGKDKVIAICQKMNGDHYINSIGGQELYDKDEFVRNNIRLNFIKMNPNVYYKQFDNEFIQGLSILDVLMFCSVDDVKKMLEQYELV